METKYPSNASLTTGEGLPEEDCPHDEITIESNDRDDYASMRDATIRRLGGVPDKIPPCPCCGSRAVLRGGMVICRSCGLNTGERASAMFAVSIWQRRPWISVDDRIPEVGAYIIGAHPIDDDSWLIQTGRFRPPEDHGGVAVIEIGNEGWSWITHWMIPTPPNG